MEETIIKSIISVVISGVLGYLANLVRTYKKKLKEEKEKDKVIEKALMTMLQSNLTNTYYVYEKFEELPDYVYKNWLNELAVYESLGGDDYVHTLAERIKKWKITRSDILK